MGDCVCDPGDILQGPLLLYTNQTPLEKHNTKFPRCVDYCMHFNHQRRSSDHNLQAKALLKKNNTNQE